jgi:transcriptional regulator with XRE-family HTH domain
VNRNPAARRALGKVLRAFRHRRGLSQEELAHEADVDRTYVGGVERGERNPSFENLWFLLHALGVSWAELGQALDRQPALRGRPVTRSR